MVRGTIASADACAVFHYVDDYLIFLPPARCGAKAREAWHLLPYSKADECRVGRVTCPSCLSSAKS